MRTCCLKLMPGGEPGSEEWGVERGCTQQLYIWTEPPCQGPNTRAQCCFHYLASVFSLQLPISVKPEYLTHTPQRYIRISPSSFGSFLAEVELTAFPKMVPMGISPLDSLSPLVVTGVI